jgi:hypothetical protein
MYFPFLLFIRLFIKLQPILLLGRLHGRPRARGGITGKVDSCCILLPKKLFCFNTCPINSNSTLNIELFDLFNRGKDELAGNLCSDLSSTAERIKEVFLTILIQGTFNCALLNADLLSDSKSEDLAKGYIMTQAF